MPTNHHLVDTARVIQYIPGLLPPRKQQAKVKSKTLTIS